MAEPPKDGVFLTEFNIRLIWQADQAKKYCLDPFITQNFEKSLFALRQPLDLLPCMKKQTTESQEVKVK